MVTTVERHHDLTRDIVLVSVTGVLLLLVFGVLFDEWVTGAIAGAAVIVGRSFFNLIRHMRSRSTGG
jgi:uncharacterized membrane protein YjjB (DUF3815 family)